MTVRVRVPAKINLALCVGALADDGFHPLTTVFEAVDLWDELTLRPADDVRLTITGEGADAVPTGPANLAHRAFTRMASEFALPTPGAVLEVHKAIPVAGGMAGGSADAAATLLAVDAWAGLGLGRDRLGRIAAELGSDVPFALLGGLARGTGRGDRLEPITRAVSHTWVLALAEGGLSTPAVYGRFDELHPAGCSLHLSPGFDAALADPRSLAPLLRNDLQAASLALRPALADVLAAGERHGALAGLVSGSGPTCVFLCADTDAAARVAAGLGGHPEVAGVRCVTGPVPGAHVVAA